MRSISLWTILYFLVGASVLLFGPGVAATPLQDSESAIEALASLPSGRDFSLHGPTTAPADLKEKRQGNGNNDTINGNGNTQNDGNTNNVSSSGQSHGLSQSDQIAVGVGVGGGIVAIIGVYLTYIGLKRRKEQHKASLSVASPSQPSQPYGSSWPGQHSFTAYRHELPAQR